MPGLGRFLAAASALLGVPALVFDANAAKNRPVTKVITLLQDMLKQLGKEATEDQEVYDKMACWCATNDREKTRSVADAQTRITDLTNKIEELTASSARLNVEIKGLKDDVKKNQESLDQATALREKQLAEFNGEEKDLLGSISALKAALVILSKHHSGALLQKPSGSLLSVATTVHSQLQRYKKILAGVLTPTEQRLVEAFTQAPESYSPQSGQIFGILQQMLETFQSNLAQAQKDEQNNGQVYEGLKSSKQAEIRAWQSHLDTKLQELASTDQKLAQSKEDIEDTRDTLAADQQFLLMLKEKCSLTDKEFEERQKTRNSEMEAVSKAVAVLSSDDAHDLFSKTFNPSLLQKSASAHSQRQLEAAKLLRAAARRLRSPELSALAAQVSLDAFTRVKQAIDNLVSQLQKQKEDEIKHKDFCVDEFNTNQLETERKEREKQGHIAKMEELQMSVEAIGKAIDVLKGDIAELQLQLKRAGEDREAANKDFQSTIADQRETQKLLQQALAVLAQVYRKPAALTQVGAKASSTISLARQPAGFDTYKKSEASGGVMGLIEQIIADARAMEADAIRAEDDAQKAYEGFVKDTNAAVQAKNMDIVNKSRNKAKAEGALVKAKQNKENALLELEQLSNTNAQLHQACDFVLKNFELRQTARDEEMEALQQAKAILSGAKFD